MPRFPLSLALTAALALPTLASAWEVRTENGENGDVFTVAEQVGDAGLFLQLVCFKKRFHIEVIFPEGVDSASDGAELLQVDRNAERLLAGFYDRIDQDTTAFIGIDRTDAPAKATKDLLQQMRRGQHLYLGDPDRSEAVEVWSLKGATKAMNAAKARCQ